MKVSTRLGVLVATALCAMMVLAGVGLVTLKHSMMEDRRNQIADTLHMATQLLGYYQGLESAGTLTHDEAQRQAKIALSNLNYADNHYIWVRLPDGTTVVRRGDPSMIGKILHGQTMDGRSDTDAYREAMDKDPVGFVFLKVLKPGSTEFVPKLNGIVDFKPWEWWVGTGFFNTDIDAAFWRIAMRYIAIFVVAVIVLGILSWRMFRSILLALGGDPAYASQVTGTIASGDLSAPIVVQAHDRHSLLYSIAQMQGGLAQTVATIRTGVDAIKTGSREIALGNADLSSRTEEQAAALQQTAASMDQLTATVKLNAESAREAGALATQACQTTQNGQAVVADVIATIGKINEGSAKMVQIISVIEGIAFQTNILALNAAVEAARAGDQGKGFAVVASEVRTLAQRSAAAAKEIGTLINESVRQVADGTALAGRAGEAMDGAVTAIQRVSTLVSESEVSAREQSQGIGQIGQAVTQMDEVTQQNAALVEQASAATTALAEQAERLALAVSVFKLGG